MNELQLEIEEDIDKLERQQREDMKRFNYINHYGKGWTSSCKKCGGSNIIYSRDRIDGNTLEHKTRCIDCGLVELLVSGFYDSSKETMSRCKTYTNREA